MEDVISRLKKKRTMNNKEISYLMKLIQRAVETNKTQQSYVQSVSLKLTVAFYLKRLLMYTGESPTTTSIKAEDEMLDDICPKWSGLTVQMLVDIYAVHKALHFGQFQRMEYTLSDYKDNVKNAEETTLEESCFSTKIDEHQQHFELDLYPLHLVNDDIFEVMACHYAVSSVVNGLMKQLKGSRSLHIRSVVVPRAMCSRYDGDDVHQPTIDDVDQYLKGICPSNLHVNRILNVNISSVPEMAKCIRKMIDLIWTKSIRNISIVFDRQNVSRDATFVHVFECEDWKQMSETETNYFISFDFVVCSVESDDKMRNLDGPMLQLQNSFLAPSLQSIATTSRRGSAMLPRERVVKCWLIYGVGQRLRFYPEYAVWIIPNLFVRSTTMTTFKVVAAVYGEHYKHGWRVALDDKEFNRYYHIITGFEHISNNYNRDTIREEKVIQKSLRDEMEENLKYDVNAFLGRYVKEEAFDSETILNDVRTENGEISSEDSNIALALNCDGPAFLALKFVILRFENTHCQNRDVRATEDCEWIESVIRNLQKFQECNLEIDASTVIHFDLESIINGFDHILQLHDFLADSAKKEEIQNYVSSRVKCPNGAECEILKKHSTRSRERGSAEKTQDSPHKVDSLCEAVSDALHSLHSYVLHRNDHLFRLLSGDENEKQSRFTTPAVRERRNIDGDDNEVEDHNDDEKEDTVMYCQMDASTF